MKWFLCTLVLAACADEAHPAVTGRASAADAGAGDDAGPRADAAPPGEPDAQPDAATGGHSLAFEDTEDARTLHVGPRREGSGDFTFFDGLGREVGLRGFNVSGSVKLRESGFKPFRSTEDAAFSLARLRAEAGSNVVRFTIAWEGVQPEPGAVDTAYLDAVLAQMRAAIAQEMYVIVDYHSDLYSRHTFTKDSRDTGNGAPGWIVRDQGHGTDDCGVPCLVTWSAHKTSDSAVRSAIRAFWRNDRVVTPEGDFLVQDAFLAQLEETARYLATQLTPRERDFLLGIEPINEPFEGGLSELGIADYAAFDNDLLWPFYARVRARLDAAGLGDKWVFAEPLVFWNSLAGVFAPATGGGYLRSPPGPGYVFAPHFYDQGRLGVADTSVVRNGAYFASLDQIRAEARFLGLPVLVGEFGMPLGGSGHTDNARVVNAVYQALETSDVAHAKDRFADLYTPFVHGVQWQWDHYHDRHEEYVNENPERLVTERDAWNGENFSVVTEGSQTLTVDPRLVQRVYPRRVQGRLLHFSHAADVRDAAGEPLGWNALRVASDDGAGDEELFRGGSWALAVWQGRLSDAPTELFLPGHMAAEQLVVVTERAVWNKSLAPSTTPSDARDEVLLAAERAGGERNHRLLVWDDVTADEGSDAVHFVFVAAAPAYTSSLVLDGLRQRIVARLAAGRSPLYLTGEMTRDGYPPDS